MSSKLNNVRLSSTNGNDYEDERPPKGAKITNKKVEVKTEEIENGFLVIKSISGRYSIGDTKDDRYFSYNEKWYSKNDPLTISVNNKSLADVFE